MQDRLNKQAIKHLAALQQTVKQLWEKSCEHDEIDPTAKFVVFTDDNPYIPFYNRALLQYREARQQFADGGYVGLTIKKRS